MGYKKCVLWIFMLASVQGKIVNLKSEWKPNLGWEIKCSWELFSNDTLQSVRLYNNEQQFMIYRPEIEGLERVSLFSRPEDTMRVDCAETTDNTGTCVITIELYQPQKNSIKFGCEASGERPMFRLEKKTIVIDAFVPPTKASIHKESENQETGRVMLNCTSSGLPAPNLVWRIGEQKVPHDFTDSVWNATSKLWQSWSVLSYIPSEDHQAVCTPEVSHGEQLVKGEAATENSAVHIREMLSKILALLPILLLR